MKLWNRITQHTTTALVASALSIGLPVTSQFEGKSNTPYNDIGGVKTWCYGETEKEAGKAYYSDAMCKALLADRMQEFTEYVVAQTGTNISPEELYAYSDLTYNIGKTAFLNSTVLKRFRSGDRVGACNAVRMWNKVKGKTVKGLDNRRKAEEQLCLQGVNKYV